MELFMKRQTPLQAHQDLDTVFAAILSDIKDAQSLVNSCLTLIRDERTIDHFSKRYLLLARYIVDYCPTQTFADIQDISSVDDLWATLLRTVLRACPILDILDFHCAAMQWMQEEEENMRRDTVRRLVETGRRCIGPTLAALYSCNPRSKKAQQVKDVMIRAWETYRKRPGLSRFDEWTEQDEAKSAVWGACALKTDWEEGGHRENCRRWRKLQA
ncbi:hypothetical protein EIP86_007740 [Pleurotus ostreatoroseus]|nr:hypothetical protein EIP86_007740 [Pleurotus ostreatoroseus]